MKWFCFISIWDIDSYPSNIGADDVAGSMFPCHEYGSIWFLVSYYLWTPEVWFICLCGGYDDVSFLILSIIWLNDTLNSQQIKYSSFSSIMGTGYFLVFQCLFVREWSLVLLSWFIISVGFVIYNFPLLVVFVIPSLVLYLTFHPSMYYACPIYYHKISNILLD